MQIRFMNRSLMLLLLLIGIQPLMYAQLDTNQETFRIKALALERKPLSEQFPLKLAPIVGLTNKGFEITMGIEPIDGFAKKNLIDELMVKKRHIIIVIKIKGENIKTNIT